MVDIAAIADRGRLFVPTGGLLKFRKALAKTRLGQSRTRIMCVGDSSCAGQGAGPGNVVIAGARPYAWSGRMSNKLASLGIPSQYEAVIGNANQAALYGTYDPRVNVGTWSYDGANPTAGARLFSAPSGSAVWTLTPSTACDTYEIYCISAPGYGTSTLDIGGSAPATGGSSINANAAVGVLKTTITSATATTAPLHITGPVGAVSFKLIGVIAYNSTVPGVDVVNAGWPASVLGDWADSSTAWAPASIVPNKYAPDLVITCMGANDWVTSVPLATATANLQTFITANIATSDIIVIGQYQQNPASQTTAIQNQYRAAYQALALANGCPYVDWADRNGSYAATNAAGFMFDSLHKNQVGYGDFGDFLGAALAAV
jgi:lysophospholipase L1-like esterase